MRRTLLAALLAALLFPAGAYAQRTLACGPRGAVLEVGGTLALTVAATDDLGRRAPRAAVQWASLAPGVATIEGDSIARGVADGSALLVCWWPRGPVLDTVTITVARRALDPDPDPDPDPEDPEQPPPPPPPSGRTMEVAPDTVRLAVGATATLSATLVEPAGRFACRDCAWSAADGAIVAVSGSGPSVTIMGRAAGATAVTATSQHPTSGSAVVIVSGQAPPPPPPPPPPPQDPDTTTPAPPGAWPDHEPAGFTRILHVKGDTKDWGSGFRYGGKWQDEARTRVVSDAASKYGKAIEKRFMAGDASGWHGYANQNDWPGTHRQVYFRAVFMFSPNWQHHAAGEKLWYFGIEDQGAANGYGHVLATGNGTLRIDADDAVTGVRIYETGAQWKRGEYQTLEILLTANSDVNTADGSARVWLDGRELTSWRCLGTGCDGFRSGPLSGVRWFKPGHNRLSWDGVQSFLYWGGSGDTKTVNDWLRISEFYISGKP